VHPEELPGVFVSRSASKLCPVRPRERRRVSVYVPEALVPEVQRSLDNGRALQDLLHQAAPRYIKALKQHAHHRDLPARATAETQTYANSAKTIRIDTS
jgi:hypothetical protein